MGITETVFTFVVALLLWGVPIAAMAWLLRTVLRMSRKIDQTERRLASIEAILRNQVSQ